MIDYYIFANLLNNRPTSTYCRGNSMEPVYANGDDIWIMPFSDDHPDPVIGDVVHFYAHGGFNRHQVADIFEGRNGMVWYRLIIGAGGHDQFVQRQQIWGYVVPDKMMKAGTEPCLEYVEGP